MKKLAFLPVELNLFETKYFSNYTTSNILFKLLTPALGFFLRIKYKSIPTVRQQACNTYANIEIGGGETPKRKELGYINCDIRELPEVDVYCKAQDLQKHFEPLSVNTIYGRHFLEHLTWSEIFDFISSAKVLLINNGKLELVVPSLYFSFLQVALHKVNSIAHIHGLAGLNGWQRDQNKSGYWDIHKSLFTHKIIQELAIETNMLLQFYNSQPKEIHFSLTKILQ
jgi:hypothetical protein